MVLVRRGEEGCGICPASLLDILLKEKDGPDIHQLPERHPSCGGAFPAQLPVLQLTPGKVK